MMDGLAAVGQAFAAPFLWVGGLLLPYGVWLGPLAVIVGFGLFSAYHVAKGGGQFGIIEGYVGTIGAGKTTLAVQHSLELARARKAVLLSNIPVRCGPTCKGRGSPVPAVCRSRCRIDHEHVGPGCVIEHDTLPMTDEGLDLGELTRRAFKLRDEQRGLVLLMDEVGVIMPARLWKDFSVALMWVLQQSRKLACEWVWTAQDPSFVDHQLRSLTAAVHYVRSWPPPSIWRRSRGKRPWMLIASSYTPSMAPRANGEGEKKDKRIGRRMLRYRRRWEGSFDTDGVVLPSRHLKGAEVLVAAVEGQGDRHVISAGASSWGPSAGGEVEPESIETPLGA